MQLFYFLGFIIEKNNNVKEKYSKICTKTFTVVIH